MNLKKFLTYVLFIVISTTIISNSHSIEPDVFVQSTVNRASQVLSDNSSKDQKIKKLKTISCRDGGYSRDWNVYNRFI